MKKINKDEIVKKKNTPKVKVLPLKNGSLWIHHFWESSISTIHWAPWPARKTRPTGSEKCHGNLTPRDVTLVIRLWLSMQTRQGIRWLRINPFHRAFLLSFQELVSRKPICQFLHNYTNLQRETENASFKKSAQVPVFGDTMNIQLQPLWENYLISFIANDQACMFLVTSYCTHKIDHPVLQPRMDSSFVFDL